MYVIECMTLGRWWPTAFKTEALTAALAAARNLSAAEPTRAYRVTCPSGMTVLFPARTT